VSGRRRDRPVGTRKLARGGRPLVVDPLTGRGKQERRDEDGDRQPHSTSSTSTFSPVTRCASAAAINSSISPSSTAWGLLMVTPVRRSFTIWYGWSTYERIWWPQPISLFSWYSPLVSASRRASSAS